MAMLFLKKKIYKTINGGIENLSLNEDSELSPTPNLQKQCFILAVHQKKVSLICKGNCYGMVMKKTLIFTHSARGFTS